MSSPSEALPVEASARPASLTDLFVSFSLLALQGFGGVVAVVQRELVEKKRWMTREEFLEDWAVAQIMPGPNVLFTALMGWNVGLNAGGLWAALLGTLLCLGGIMIPSTTLTYLAARWGHANRELRGVRAFKQGLAPIVIALLMATGWILATGSNYAVSNWPAWLLVVCATLIVWRTRIHLLWLLGAGALLGWLGLV